MYITPYCPYCATLKQYLKDHGVEFTEIDVAQDEDVRAEMIKKSGQIGVPVTEIDGDMVIGFDKQRIDELLKIKVK